MMDEKVRVAAACADSDPGSYEQLGGELTAFVTPSANPVNRALASTLMLEGRGRR